MTELSPRRRQLVLVICCMSVFLAALDITIVNLALPDIRKDLDAEPSHLQWSIDAYTVTAASLLILAGSTADRIGRLRIFQVGLTLFTLGSLLCSIAPTIESLIGFRVIQALGACMLNPVAMSIIANAYTDPRERARAIGVWGAVVGLSLALGPPVGGLLIDSVGWRSIFWINVPICIVALVLATLFVPDSKAPRPRRIDPVGQVLVIATLGGAVFGLIEGGVRGWDSPVVLAAFAVATSALTGLLWYEPRRVDPLIELRFFRSAPFTGATVIAACSFAGFASYLFLNSIYLQEVRGYSAVHAGMLTLPMGAMTVVCAPIAARLVGSVGPRLPLVLGGLFQAAGALSLTGLSGDTPVELLVGAYLLMGIGFGMTNPPITNTAVSGMPMAQAGVASAVSSTSRQVGNALGIAVIGSVVLTGLSGSVAEGFSDASRPGWWIVAGCASAVSILGFLSTGRWAMGTAQRAAAQLDPVPEATRQARIVKPTFWNSLSSE